MPVVVMVNSLMVIMTVVIHYEMLSALSKLLPKIKVFRRARVAVGLLGALVAHSIEIWLYALAYYALIQVGGYGSLAGVTSQSVMDCVYLSFTTYSSLGYGDIYPVGALRFVSGLEALVGLIMITWTASFVYLEMEKFWERP